MTLNIRIETFGIIKAHIGIQLNAEIERLNTKTKVTKHLSILLRQNKTLGKFQDTSQLKINYIIKIRYHALFKYMSCGEYNIL